MKPSTLAAVGIVVALLGLAGCGGTAQADSSPTPPASKVTEPIEVLLADTGNSVDVNPVFAQCDGHGHRVYASRHPIDVVVIDDPACPGGTKETTR